MSQLLFIQKIHFTCACNQQHLKTAYIHTIFSADILFYKLFTCIYRANVFRLSQMIQEQGESFKSFIPSLS